jgi:hypothetical protein
MKNCITSPWTLWFAATTCVGIGGAINIGLGDGFFMAAIGLAIAAAVALIDRAV